MTNYIYFLFTVFAIVFAMIILDSNVGYFIDLNLRLLSINFQRFIWMIRFHPNNFITTWIQNKKYDKIARELEREMQMERERKLSDDDCKTSK